MFAANKVYLRKLEKSDLDLTYKWINNPDVFITMGVFGPRSREEQENWFSNIDGSRKNLIFALCLNQSNEHIGNVSLFDINYINRNAGLTIFIGDTSCHGYGYGKEAISLLCDYAFDYLNLNKVFCKTDNEIAGKLYEKLGFEKEGILRKHEYKRGEYINKIFYGVLSEDFKSITKK